MSDKDIRASIQRAVTELKNRVNELECPMCHSKHFAVADGFFIQHLQDDFASFELGSKGVPILPVICKNCGFISQHALGFLMDLTEQE